MQKYPQPPQDEAEIIAGGGEDGVDAVDEAAVQIVPPEMSLQFHVTDDRLDGGATAQLALDLAVDAALLAAPSLKVSNANVSFWIS